MEGKHCPYWTLDGPRVGIGAGRRIWPAVLCGATTTATAKRLLHPFSSPPPIPLHIDRGQRQKALILSRFHPLFINLIFFSLRDPSHHG